MKKISKKYSSAVAQGMFVFTVAVFIMVAMLFGSCSSSVDRDNYEEEFRYNNVEHNRAKIADGEYLSTFTFEGRRYTVWDGHYTSQLLHIENLEEDAD